MITSITISGCFGNHSEKRVTGQLAGYKLPSLPVGYILDTDSYLVILIGDNGSGKSTFLNKIWSQYTLSLITPKYYDCKYDIEPKIRIFNPHPQMSKVWYLMTESADYQNNPQIPEYSKGQYSLFRIEEFISNCRGLPPEYILILDQPEDGIALRRRQKLVDMISENAFTQQRQTFIATHEPRFLNVPEAIVINLDNHPAEVCKAKKFDLEKYLSTALKENPNHFLWSFLAKYLNNDSYKYEFMSLLDGFNKKDASDFKKEVEQLVRITTGINKDFGKVNKRLDKYLDNYKKLIKLFNKKYSNLFFKTRVTLDEVKLSIFLRNEKNVKDVFINVAGKIMGLKSIGSKGVRTVDMANREEFSNEINSIKDQIYISYYNQDAGSTILFLEYNKKQKMVELHFDLKSMSDERNPEFELIAYYALKDVKEDINILSEGMKFGFLDLLDETEKKEWLEQFNPRFGE